MAIAITLDKASQQTERPPQSPCGRIILSPSAIQSVIRSRIQTLKQDTKYLVKQVKTSTQTVLSKNVSSEETTENFTGTLRSIGYDAAGLPILFFDSIAEGHNSTKNIRLANGKIELIEVDKYRDEILPVLHTSPSLPKPSPIEPENMDFSYESMCEESDLDYDNKAEIPPSNLRESGIIEKLRYLLHKGCAVIWGERDLGDFYFKSFSESEGTIDFAFEGGTMVFTIFRDKIRVVVSDWSKTKSEIRERTDTLHIIPKLNQ